MLVKRKKQLLVQKELQQTLMAVLGSSLCLQRIEVSPDVLVTWRDAPETANPERATLLQRGLTHHTSPIDSFQTLRNSKRSRVHSSADKNKTTPQ